MGFLAPAPPPVDVKEWRTKPHLERIKPLAQDWAVNGFGTPTAIYLLYVVKLIVFSVGGFLLIAATTSPGANRRRCNGATPGSESRRLGAPWASSRRPRPQ